MNTCLTGGNELPDVPVLPVLVALPVVPVLPSEPDTPVLPVAPELAPVPPELPAPDELPDALPEAPPELPVTLPAPEPEPEPAGFAVTAAGARADVPPKAMTIGEVATLAEPEESSVPKATVQSTAAAAARGDGTENGISEPILPSGAASRGGAMIAGRRWRRSSPSM